MDRETSAKNGLDKGRTEILLGIYIVHSQSQVMKLR